MYRDISDIPPLYPVEQPREDVSTEGGMLRYQNAHLRNEKTQAHHELDMLAQYRPDLETPRRNHQGIEYTIMGRLQMLRDKLA